MCDGNTTVEKKTASTNGTPEPSLGWVKDVPQRGYQWLRVALEAGGWRLARGKRLREELRWNGATLTTVTLRGVHLPMSLWWETGGGVSSGKPLGNQLWTETGMDQQLTNARAWHPGLAAVTSAFTLDIASWQCSFPFS